MSKVIGIDSMSNVAQKIFEKNKISVDVKTGLPEEEIVKIISEYDGILLIGFICSFVDQLHRSFPSRFFATKP